MPTKKTSQAINWKLVAMCGLIGFGGGYIGSEVNTNTPASNIERSVEHISSESDLIAALAERVGPSVVSIEVLSSSQSIFGTRSSQGSGTGVILSNDGYVVTNRHVVPEGSLEVSVILSDGTRYDNVEIVGRDPRSSVDIAFLKIPGVNSLSPAELGDSDSARVGDKVIAIGNALGEYQNTVTTGIISGNSRPVNAFDSTGSEALNNLLQTDAAINPGNSGGPLFDINGKVIGINTAVANGEGIGFAIPISDIRASVQVVLSTGELTVPYIGVRYSSITADFSDQFNLDSDRGAYLYAGPGASSVIAGSPAEKAGLLDKDIILSVNGVDLDRETSLAEAISRLKVGDSIDLVVLRESSEVEISVVLEEAPEDL